MCSVDAFAVYTKGAVRLEQYMVVDVQVQIRGNLIFE
jgi:hypothetical protein